MKKTRFKVEQIVKTLREADQAPVAEATKRHGVSVATIYGWRQRFGKLEATEGSPNADFRRAVHRLTSSCITTLIGVSPVRLHLSRKSLGHYMDADRQPGIPHGPAWSWPGGDLLLSKSRLLHVIDSRSTTPEASFVQLK